MPYDYCEVSTSTSQENPLIPVSTNHELARHSAIDVR
jgi:hypothetical protein